MAKELSENDKKFVQRNQNHLHEATFNFVNSHISGDILARNLLVDDYNYIMGRVRKILEEKYAQIDFNSEIIAKARMDLLKQTISEAKTKKANKPKEKDEFAQQRADRCEPVCRNIVDKLLDEELLLSNPEYVPTAISEDDRLLLYVLVKGYVDFIDGHLEVLAHDVKKRANALKWGGKEPYELTWKDIQSAFDDAKQ